MLAVDDRRKLEAALQKARDRLLAAKAEALKMEAAIKKIEALLQPPTDILAGIDI